MSRLNHLYSSIMLVSILLTSPLIVAQGETSTAHREDIEYVKWISEFPSKGEKPEKINLTKRIGDLLFGKETMLFEKPVSVVAESPYKYWAVDQQNSAIVYVEGGKGELLEIKTYGDQALSSMVGICMIPERGLLFSDSRLNEVFLLEDGSTSLKIFGDSINWQQPTGVSYSSLTNEIWVVETSAHRISIINFEGELKKVIGKRGTGPAEFNFPTHIWIDTGGFVYVVDAMNSRVQIFDKEGEFVSLFGESGDGTGYFAKPKGIATDSFGNIYVVDALFHAVQIFNRNGQLLYYFGGQGRGRGEFWMPSGIFIDQEDNIYVSDTYNSRIQVFSLINIEKNE